RKDLDAELLGAVNTALDAIDTDADVTTKTRDYVECLRGMQAGLVQHRLKWSEWVKLSKQATGAKSRAYAESVQAIAGDFEKHPGLHADIRNFCDEVFDLAADSIETYQRFKAQQGLLDFVDQEQRVYELLDHPHVCATLRDELQVLLVDEFQDTSPIQLALFMKLAALAERVVWVGDVKQAIYGFRGSDPALMQAVLRAVAERGGRSDVLEHSWRSRPALVEYVNEIFVPAFAETLRREEVALTAQREEQCEEHAVACWSLAGRNWEHRANGIAYGLQRLVDSGYRVADKLAKTLRHVEYGDIAVLCRMNDRLQQIAAAFERARIPVAFKRPGLLATPEGALALAALRRFADRADSLASAEIRTLTRSESPEGWLAERMACLGEDAKPWAWGETGERALPELEALAAARTQRRLLTPSEALELALVKGRVREAAIAWGPTAEHTRHRLRNIDLLLEYAAQYEDQCGMQSAAATLSGLVLWLRVLAEREEDWQAETGDGRAVTLVTHHGAKGLEWPVVIAVDLDSNVRSRLWGLTVLECEQGFDIEAPLAGRRLRYWPWPFGKQSTGIPVSDAMNESVHGVNAQAAAIEETRRLLYVSLTRARDCLIIALDEKTRGGEWLETLAADWMLPAGETLSLPNGVEIPSACETIEAPDDWAVEAPPPDARWVLPGAPREDLLNRGLTPSSAAAVPAARAGAIIEIGERLALDGVQDITALGEALHGLIAAEIVAPDAAEGTRAARILKAWGFEGSVAPAAASRIARGFVAWATAAFEPLAWHVEHPLLHVLETGQVVHGYIDLLLETQDGFIIVDHKATPRPRTEWRDIAEQYSGQLGMYKAAVESITRRPVLGTWIHFASGGGAVEVSLGG
ncbi:MAG TPA: UvrD-helicase domain-containing protein, partial [Gammaproteobacteria bacterium]|nr:UvrD-helicase domain-containing protein [Gammaproteobacteria bacterium]